MSLFNRVVLFCICNFIFFQAIVAQENSPKRWNLEECINYAIENNIQLAQNQLQVEQSKLNLMQSKASVLPNLSGSASHIYNFGRRIDPFTNQFANNRVLSQNFSVSGNINLISGLSNTSAIQAGQLDLIASKLGNDQLKNEIALNVTNSFLQVILSTQLASIAEEQVKLSREQKERSRKLLDAGQISQGDFYQVEAQLATEEFNLVTAQNGVALAYLTLAQLLNLESADGFEIILPNMRDDIPELPLQTAREIFVTAKASHPGVLSSEFRYKSALKSLRSSKGGFYPSLSLFGGLGTGYSELARTQAGSTISTQYLGQIQGQDIFIDVPTPIFIQTPFDQQLNQNFNRTFGLTLTVPIFSGLQVRTAVGRSRINAENALLQNNLQNQQLQREVQSAWLDAKSAFERYKAAQKSSNALRTAFQYVSQRFEVGLLNPVEYTLAKTNLARAESEQSQALYEYILRLKVLDFYQGKPIRL